MKRTITVALLLLSVVALAMPAAMAELGPNVAATVVAQESRITQTPMETITMPRETATPRETITIPRETATPRETVTTPRETSRAPVSVPEFPTVVLPIAAVMGLVMLLLYRRSK